MSQEFEALIFSNNKGPISSIFTTSEITEEMKKSVRKEYIPVEKIEKVDQGFSVTRKNGSVEFHPFVNTVKAVDSIPKEDEEE